MATKTVRILPGGNNNHQENAFSFNALGTDFFSPGIVGGISLNTGSGGTGGFAVNAESSPTMQVRVSAGVCWVTVVPSGGVSQLVRVDMSTFEDETIASNSSGSTKYDWIYVAVDPAKSINPAVDASDVATISISRSTSSSVDNGTPPLYGLAIGVVTVANGAASIVNANIADKRAQTGTNFVAAAVTKFSAYVTAAHTYTNYNKVQLDTKTFDTGANFDAVTNNRFVAPVSGFYFFDGAVSFVAASTTDHFLATLYKNGTEVKRGTEINSAVGSGSVGVSVAGQLQLAAGDYMELWCYASPGRAINTGAITTYFDGYLVSTT
jgi:hypothetical protein